MGWSQHDSLHVRNIPSVEIVKAIKIERTQTRAIQKDEIERLAPIDLGDLLQKLPGTTIRSYGSIGALKTIAFNGLGAQHSSILLDGFVISNMIAGQANLSQIQVEGIKEVALTDERIRNRLLPVKSRLLGNSLSIYSGLFHKEEDKGSLAQFNAGYSSFNTYDIGGRYKWSGKKVFLSAFGYHRSSDGDYAYLFENGDSSEEELRSNNDFKEVAGSIGAGVHFSRSVRGRLKLTGKKFEQGLPGAIILYNDTRDERLNTDEFEINADLSYFRGQHYMRMYYSGLMRSTVYNDPTYLNSQGFLRNQYVEQDHTLGIASFLNFNKIQFESGISGESQVLTTFGVDFGSPNRFIGAGFVKLEHSIGKWKGIYQLGSLISHQVSNDENTTLGRLMPRLKFFRIGKRNLHSFELINSYRLPSFNELFFGTIGNPDLLPENAYQFKYAFTRSIEKGIFKSVFEIGSNASYVDNKIVSVPTKNMFVWSIQNIHKTLGASGVVANNSSLSFRKLAFMLSMNYQFQKVLDISDPDGATYLDQIAYVPEHTASFDVGVNYNKYQLNISNYLVGYRYVLNENVDANLENGYLLTDISLRVDLLKKSKHKLTIQGVVKNIFDVQYAYIRGFVMPGRNYVIKLRYGIN